jgi:hypothetical protein
MRTLELIGQVESGGRLTVQLLSGIPPGEPQIVLVIDERPLTLSESHTLGDFPVDDHGPWPEGLSLRLEDMYGKWGR